jgi:hypothetical protein
MNYISPHLQAAAASTRTHDDVLNERIRRYNADVVGQIAALGQPKPVASDFGSIAYAKVEERQTMETFLAAVETFRAEITAAVKLSNTDMEDRLLDLLSWVDAAIHDAAVSKAAWEVMIEAMA